MDSDHSFQRTFSGSEGQIHYQVWSPPKPKAIVIVVHGYAEYGARYAHLANHLVQHDFLVAAPDHIGHGHSEGERALIADFEHVVDDLQTLAAWSPMMFGGALALLWVARLLKGQSLQKVQRDRS